MGANTDMQGVQLLEKTSLSAGKPDIFTSVCEKEKNIPKTSPKRTYSE